MYLYQCDNNIFLVIIFANQRYAPQFALWAHFLVSQLAEKRTRLYIVISKKWIVEKSSFYIAGLCGKFFKEEVGGSRHQGANTRHSAAWHVDTSVLFGGRFTATSMTDNTWLFLIMECYRVL